MITKKVKTNYFLAGLILFAMSIFYLPSNAKAIEYGLLGGRPANPDPNIENSDAWFIYNLEAGEKKEDAIEIMNLFDTEMNVLIYAADSIHSSSGGFALRQFSEPKDEVGSWVKFYTTEPPKYFDKVFSSLDKKIIDLCEQSKEDLVSKLVESEELEEGEEVSDENMTELSDWCKGEESFELNLKGKEQLKIPFVFTVSEKADVGEHTGGILIQKVAAEDTTTKDGSAVKLTTRVGVRIYETVPGDIIKSISLESFEVNKNFEEFDLSRFFFMKWFGKNNEKPEDYTVTSRVINSGNVSVEFEEVIKVEDAWFSKKTSEVTRKYQALKDDFFISNFSWESPRFGYFKFSKVIKYSDQNDAEQVIETSSISKLILPWREVVTTLIIVLIGAGIYFGRKIYLNKKYNISSWKKYTVEDGDSINSLADANNIDWQVIAKINKIKAPFKLEIGDQILVPSDGEEGPEDEDDSVDSIGSDKVSEDDSSDDTDIVSGSSIAETLWEDSKKKEVTTEIDSLTEKKDKEKSVDEDEVKKDKEKPLPESSGADSEADLDAESKKEDEKRMAEYLLKKKVKRMWIYISIAAVALIVVVYAAFSMGKSSAEKEVVVVKEEVPVPQDPVIEQESANQEEQEDEASEENKDREADFSKVNILVLNGGSTAGAAGEMKDAVAAGDETIENIEADNATGEYTDKTVIYYGEEFDVEANNLAEILSEEYGELELMSIDELPEDEKKEDIVILIGEK